MDSHPWSWERRLGTGAERRGGKTLVGRREAWRQGWAVGWGWAFEGRWVMERRWGEEGHHRQKGPPLHSQEQRWGRQPVAQGRRGWGSRTPVRGNAGTVRQHQKGGINGQGRTYHPGLRRLLFLISSKDYSLTRPEGLSVVCRGLPGCRAGAWRRARVWRAACGSCRAGGHGAAWITHQSIHGNHKKADEKLVPQKVKREGVSEWAAIASTKPPLAYHDMGRQFHTSLDLSPNFPTAPLPPASRLTRPLLPLILCLSQCTHLK